MLERMKHEEARFGARVRKGANARRGAKAAEAEVKTANYYGNSYASLTSVYQLDYV